MTADHKTSLAVIEVLAEQYPQCFVVFERRRRPLKLGIHHDVLAALNIAPKGLGFAMKVYTGNAAYLRACIEGAPRIDLNGNVAGTVTAEEAANAKQRLEQRHSKQKRDAAAQAKAQAEARNAGRASLEDLREAARARKLTAV